MSEIKNMKIRITSPAHCNQVIDYLTTLGYTWFGNARPHIKDVAYLYTYNTGNIKWDDESGASTFASKINQEVIIEQKPIEYVLKPVKRHTFKVEDGELFINDVKVGQKYVDQWLINIDGEE